MKKILLSATALSLALTASAFAADLPSRKAPVFIPPPPPLVWTGFYAGLNIGGGWNANNPNNEGSIYFDPNYAFGGTGFLP
ncbi:MAG TPA: porin family protein, partial [Methylocystis sp.]|nr:porin family protein [Methylocystis sp.]